MVQNLNILSFAPYGRLLPDDTSWAAGAERITVKTDDVGLFCADGPVYLDYEAGMSLLAIADGAQYRYFYLDKPVCLHPGVIFSVLPYQAECTVKISGPRHPAKPGQLPQQSPGPLPENPGGSGIHLLLPGEGTGVLLPGRASPHAGTDLCGQGKPALRGRRTRAAAGAGGYDHLQPQSVAHAVRRCGLRAQLYHRHLRPGGRDAGATVPSPLPAPPSGRCSCCR